MSLSYEDQISLDQIEIFVQLAGDGTFAQAAKNLRRSQSTLVYGLKNLESALGVELFDRSGYRIQLSAAGRDFLPMAQSMLRARRRMAQWAEMRQSGWESELHVVCDGIFWVEAVLDAIEHLKKLDAPTKVHMHTRYLGEVEKQFEALNAQFMILLTKPGLAGLASIPLPKIRSVLVAAAGHPLVAGDAVGHKTPSARVKHRSAATQKKLTSKTTPSARPHTKSKSSRPAVRAQPTLEELRQHTLVTIRHADASLGLGTQELGNNARLQVTDFWSKKITIQRGMGFGWLPEYLIADELASKKLVPVDAPFANEHVFQPFLHYRNDAPLGHAATAFLEHFQNAS